MLEYMSECRIFVLPSRTESMGRVLVEAMTFSKPVIGSRVDGIPNILKHDFNGLLFESENVQDLSSKILDLILDPVLIQRVGSDGKSYAFESLSEKKYVEHFYQMLKDSIKS